MRRKTQEVYIGNKIIGGNNPILVQSMTNTSTKDVKSTLKQIRELIGAGCEIIRVAVPDMESAKALKEIKKEISIPLVADIHFDYKLAIESTKYADKIRINPGNIGTIQRIKAVVEACKTNNVAIRVGVNSGSLNKEIEKKYGKTPKGLFESAKEYVKLFENLSFTNMVFSIKSSDIIENVQANRLFSKEFDYPLHLGITEAGTKEVGIIRSCAGLGSLLIDGIGDTLRISLTDNPVEEIYAQIELLKGLKLRKGRTIISCPTCARTTVDLIGIAKEITARIKDDDKDVVVAIMGCEVNGPGEAKHADLGVACSSGKGYFFKKGKIIKNVPEKEIIEEFVKEYNQL
jgi:(E)-4-hydroxy-3-methylbut-2-enyl-diphosphate synthase